jgi:hypothetical protein
VKITYLGNSVVTPPHTRVRRLEDYARPQKTTRGTKLSGRWDSRATGVTVRYVAPRASERVKPRVVDSLARYDARHALYA